MLGPKVLNAREDRDAAPGLIAAAQVPTVAVLARTVAPADLTAAGDYYVAAVQRAAAFPRGARVPSGKVAVHNCASVGLNVEWESRFGRDVQVAQITRGDPFRPAVGSVPGGPADHFCQVDRFSRTVLDALQGFRFPLRSVWWEQWAFAVLAASR